MNASKLIKIGDRIINVNKITHVVYMQELQPGEPPPTDTLKTVRRCDVSFSPEDFVFFFDQEADQVWAYLSGASTHITPNKSVNAAD